jgi:hypothetical protein
MPVVLAALTELDLAAMVELLFLVQLHLLAVGAVEIVQEELLLWGRQGDLAAAVHGEPLITQEARLLRQDKVTPVEQERLQPFMELVAAGEVLALLVVVMCLEVLVRLAVRVHLLTRHGVQRLAQART